MSMRKLNAVAIGLIVGLLVVGWMVGNATVEVPTGVTGATSCGSPWSPSIGPTGPLVEVPVTAAQCSAATLPLAIVAAVVSGVGFMGLVGLIIARMMMLHAQAMTGRDASGIYLGPRRNLKYKPGKD